MRRRRGRAAVATLLAVLGVLTIAFFRLQVLRSSTYMLRSEENRLRAIPVPAPRGTIYDRDGRVVAENVPGYVISLLPGPADTVRAMLGRLAPYLDIGPEEREALYQKFRKLPNHALVLRGNASFEQVSVIEERRPEFRRVVVEMRPRRQYPVAGAVAHLAGYVGEISETELERSEFADYEPGRVIGKAGIEKQYEDRLGGTPGVRYVEVSALGSIVREFGVQHAVEARPGDDLHLGIDLELQALADSAFPDSMRGGVVALDPRNGEVLLLYSHPTFDPNAFVGGIPVALWDSLRTDPDRPLLDRATTATYSPGSTWKLVLAAIGMREERVGIATRMPQGCGGALRYGNRLFRCWKRSGHGSLDLSGAIKHSCNVYFYQLGMRLGLDAITEGTADLGFNQLTGLDLPQETKGLFPLSRDWYDRRYGPRGWTESVVLNLAIGQGENQQTLLRQALFYSALSTGEPPVVPHLARDEVLASRHVPWELGLPEEGRRDLVEAMTRVVNEPGGTAYFARLRRWTLAGKTGTAQNPHGEPHSWFVGFAPARDPVIAIAALVEFGHPDNTLSLAVPLASRLVQRYLETEGVPPEVPPSPAPAAGSGGGGAAASPAAGGGGSPAGAPAPVSLASPSRAAVVEEGAR